MLKDKYSFQHSRTSVGMLYESIALDLQRNVCTEKALCLLVLEKFLRKLLFDMNFSARSVVKISLNKKEALAFHIAYSKSFINHKNPFVNEIFTAIDRTL